MLQKFHKRNNKGFTLIELMIVVVIIGILAALAIPRFMKASAKSKTSEAQLVLKQIYTMERAYKQQFDVYSADLTALGVEVPPGANYTYTVEAADATSFTAQADWPAPGLDDDDTPDTWTIDEDAAIVHTSDDLAD
jgi:prepilin-type N-terminal cleavage/methylation domain-containing protein